MSYHVFQHYIFETDTSIQPQLNYQDNSENMLRQLQNQLQNLQNNNRTNTSNISNSSTINNQIYLPTNPWIPNQKFTKLLNTFKTSILNQFICASCAFCGRLMYPEKCEWLPYDENFSYPILQARLQEQFDSLLTFHTRLPPRIAVCLSCKKPSTRYIFPILHPIPNEIKAVPLSRRMYLSPVFMHCSLGKNSANSAIYSEYRTLTGTMNFSKNMRALTLYSGMIGAYLENDIESNSNNNWLDNTLVTAANWLKLHNPFLKSYSQLLDLPGSEMANPFPRASHISDDDSAPPFLQNDIIVPTSNFNLEIHNEDFHYTHLMADFTQISTTTLLFSFDDPNLEALVFPDLFPDGKGHYHDIISKNNNIIHEETYSKYIK